MLNSTNLCSSKKTISFVLLFLLLAATLVTDSFAQFSKGRPGNLNSWKPKVLLPNTNPSNALYTVERTDFWITLSDNTQIDAVKFVPTGTPPPGGWFTVIMVHGYGDNKNTLADFCRAQAEYGYYTMTFSVRGQGLSGGLSNLISRTEMNDMLQIINWVRNDSINGSNPNKILIMGGSQGGLLPMMAACSGAPIRTLITSVAPPDFASSWIENGCIKMTLLWTIEYPSDTARYTPLVNRMSTWIYNNNKISWDSLAYWLPRDRDFVDLIPNCQVPVLVEASWQDKFFNASGWIENLPRLTVPFSSYLGAVHGHGGEQSANEDQWHMEWFNDWFFQWLWDMETGILNKSKYQYAKTTFPVNGTYWSFVHDSLNVPYTQASSNLRLYFNRNSKLTITPNNTNATATLKNTVGRGYTMQQMVYSDFKGTEFNNKFKINSIYFETTPLAQDLEWTGIPKINIDYYSSASMFCQYNFQVWEVQPNGSMRFINRLNYTDRNYTKNSRRLKNFKGQAHSHLFKAGNKIRIVLTNFDRVAQDSAFFGNAPFVLPTLNNGNHYIYLNAKSYIDLPVVPVTAAPQMVFMPEKENSLTETPVSYSLSQNYPNPFNPITTINYSIAKAGNVEIKVFDLLGREVATLVNDFKQAGSYEVTLNASNLSSGVYFYKLESGNFSEVKRMVLLK